MALREYGQENANPRETKNTGKHTIEATDL